MYEYSIKVFKTLNNNFFWILKGENRKVLARSENFTRKEMCWRTAKKIAYKIGCGINFIDMNECWDEEYKN